jgi:two-component system chemotaxis response regulator CheB
LIANHTALAVKLAEDGMPFSPGEVYIAPSDRHLALQDGVMRVFRGPRENGARPAIDVLFRSAAVSHGARVVGVLLSGSLSDGSLGLAAVKRCGGVALVQAPTEAQKDEMPRRALRATPVDHCLPAAQLADQLAAIIPQPAPESPPVPEDLRVEARLALRAADPYHRVEQLGQPIPIVCPECSGPLTEVRHHDSFGFRCHIGHAYSPEAMLTQHSLTLERALWVAFRTLKERGVLLSQLAEDARARGLETSASGFEERLRELEDHAASVHRAIATVSELPSEEHTWNGE